MLGSYSKVTLVKRHCLLCRFADSVVLDSDSEGGKVIETDCSFFEVCTSKGKYTHFAPKKFLLPEDSDIEEEDVLDMLTLYGDRMTCIECGADAGSMVHPLKPLGIIAYDSGTKGETDMVFFECINCYEKNKSEGGEHGEHGEKEI